MAPNVNLIGIQVWAAGDVPRHRFKGKIVRFEVRSLMPVENFMAGNNPTRPSLVVRVKAQRRRAVLYLRLGAGMSSAYRFS